MGTCVSVAYFTRSGTSSKKEQKTKHRKKHRNHLSAKLNKNYWLLAIFQLNDNRELFDSIRKVLSQNNECYTKIVVGVRKLFIKMKNLLKLIYCILRISSNCLYMPQICTPFRALWQFLSNTFKHNELPVMF